MGKSIHNRTRGGDDFAQAIAKIAVVQICESEGFQAFQLSALQTMSDIAVRYIQSIGKNAHSYANIAGRTECNIFDIIQGLEDLCSPQGFSGVSDVDHCLSSSGVVKEIVQYAAEVENIRFPYTIPQFPVVKESKLASSYLQAGEVPPENHIPAWLPRFPEPHTYTRLPKPNDKDTESIARLELEKQQKVDQSLLNLQLQQRFVCNGFDGPSSVEPVGADKSKQEGESNPFLVAPLESGKKEVSHVLPAKLSNEAIMRNPVSENHVLDNHVSMLETFAPAIEAMKGSSMDFERPKKVFLNRRPAVQFKIGIEKKFLGNLFHSSPENEAFEKISPWFRKESEKDEKIKRAEKILKTSMENQQELAQL
ncbi:hypothetical protein UlMin_014576 [Ulmus minor]